MREVADALGVSVATVSNAFNRPDQLSPALRERVLAEATRRGLGTPDPAARALRRGRYAALGVVYTDRLSYAFSDPGAVLFLQGVSRACERAEVELVLIPRAASAAETAVGRSLVDGVVVYSVADDDPVLAAALERRMPAVVVDQPRDAGAPWVGVDEERACRKLCRHVLELGHRRLAVIATELDRSRRGGLADRPRQDAATFAATRARLRGYRTAAEAAGIDWATVPVWEATGSEREQGRAAAAALLDARPPPTALLAMTDELALGALSAARGVSITGFDDLPAAAAAGLTTVAQPHMRKGELAATLLLDLLAGRPPARRTRTLRTQLQLRASVAPSVAPGVRRPRSPRGARR
jgi:DNA-binding LacI/PurR family transcriptional regulator